jgi:Protein of unknown function (DUF3443)
MKDLRKFLGFAACFGVVFSVGCGGGSGNSTSTSTTPPNTIASSGTNVAPITVNTGPSDSGFLYANGAFVNVTLCVPGTSTCQTIGEVLVDTGSFGLRIVSSPVLTLSLPQETASDGNPMVECLQFLDSYTWGPVQTADIQIGGEKASAVPIQVLSDTDYVVPDSCSSPSGDVSADTVPNLGANGILGIGQLPEDCGVNATCPASANQYYSCASATATCTQVAATAGQQVPNPVSLFTTDNNGVIIELPAVSGAESAVSGSLVFGIGTESNNGLGSATVYNADPQTLNFSTSFNGTNYSDAAFIDSGSNGYFFNDSSIATCSTNVDFFCPSSAVNLSATTQGFSTGTGTVDFSVANADNLFTEFPNDAAFSGLAGPAGNPPYFDWGLPFFYGRNVYTAIDGATAPGGTAPYWAY